MSNVSLKKINKIYPNGFHAVKNIDLEIGDKEFMVLVGPSGCGKTTTLRMIAGLEDISDGELLIGDNKVNNVHPKDRNIAMVFQNYALYPHMSVYENMAFGLKLRKVAKDQIDEKVNKAAKILGITDLLDRKPKQLSGGQRQRVALGRAIVREPEVFLMDEPLSNLDAKLRVQMRAELIKLHNELDSTFIYVTHDQTEAMTMGSQICVMNNGVIQQVAASKVIYDKPQNMFVAGFIGAPQMNFINIKIEEDSQGLFTKLNEYRIDFDQFRAEKLKSKGYIGKEVVLGIRPEDIITSNNSGIRVTLDVTELLGSEINVYFSINGISFIARTNTDFDKKIGDEGHFAFNVQKTQLFDKDTENTIIW
jgi:multiple sugar transport system ATP-binding protein